MSETRKELRRLLSRQSRHLVLTHHAQLRAAEREVENRLIQSDLKHGRIMDIRKQGTENFQERVFDIRLIGIDGVPMRYVIAINSLIRVITLMKISRMSPR